MEKLFVLVAFAALFCVDHGASGCSENDEKGKGDFEDISIRPWTIKDGDWYKFNGSENAPHIRARSVFGLDVNKPYSNFTMMKLKVKFQSTGTTKIQTQVNLMYENTVLQTMETEFQGSGAKLWLIPNSNMTDSEINKVMIDLNCRGSEHSDTCKFKLKTMNACKTA